MIFITFLFPLIYYDIKYYRLPNSILFCLGIIGLCYRFYKQGVSGGIFWLCCGLTVGVMAGGFGQRLGMGEKPFDESMLTNAQHEQVELGLKTLDDFKPYYD